MLDHPDLLQHFFPEFGVQVGDGFVHDDDFVAAHQGTGNGHALLLAAGELAGQMFFIAYHADLFQGVFGTAGHLVLVHPHFFHGIQDILHNCQMGPDRIVLEYHADMAAFGGHVDPVFGAEHAAVSHVDGACLRFDKTQQAAHQGGLAAAGRPYQAQDLAFFHGQGKIFQDAFIPIVERDVFKTDISHRFSSMQR